MLCMGLLRVLFCIGDSTTVYVLMSLNLLAHMSVFHCIGFIAAIVNGARPQDALERVDQ
ncbi:uncharacterized protein B0H18DRAFT_1041253 [Fomitopsis serialis]|uniref:uncharacterized protein n=1 Tax=Fomitopsis serialis TaxID=139415 RepID=UPI0020073D3B|nr:uncharacterized protein B0H18DRAFT_1041253 [Neoantrodia serialis]KAH9915521.1 hypothetical protein B0H18DRAFT_1041253 [Neoantrodia serialis]